MFLSRKNFSKPLHFLSDVTGDFRRGLSDPARLTDDAEAVLAVLLAIVFAHLLNVAYVGWAAFSGYMVMRGHVADSIQRGLLRVTGTILGALCAVCAQDIYTSVLLSSLLLAGVTGVTLYNALLSRHGYAWLFMGITFGMVAMDGIQNGGELQYFARSRIVEVLVGTAACIIVSALSTWLVRPRLAQPLRQSSGRQVSRGNTVIWHKSAFWHSTQAALAMALIPAVWQRFDLVSLSQTCITIMAVMMVPLSVFSAPKHPTTTKIVHRFVGCFSGATLGFLALLISHQNILLLTLLLVIGILTGRHIENGTLKIKYVGTQFTLALLVILVPDSYVDVSIAPGIERLSGILFGIVILEPVRHVPQLCRMLLALFKKFAHKNLP